MTTTFSEQTEITLNDIVHELRAVRSLLASQQAELLGSKAAARFLGVSVATLYRLVSSNDTLKPVTIGRGCRRWKRAALAAYVNSLRK